MAALGVVYGDIGTSPLYAIRECFVAEHGIAPTPANILGILSLLVWSLVLVVVFKYLTFIMRADNAGEGGILALLALLAPRGMPLSGKFGARMLVVLGIIGAALLYGDGIITPSISVLSAIEGLEVATDFFTPYVVPITVAILFVLFWFQDRGTAGVGKVFGPATAVWFATLATTGAVWIAAHPSVLSALSPVHAAMMFVTHGKTAFFVLSAVVLVVTGTEALYADMGHFGKRPIRLAWYAIVFPALTTNYLGQGALLLSACSVSGSTGCAHALKNPFYGLVDGWMIYPLVVIATVATVVASQALISGAFSLTQQAIQLGFLPRLTIVHTSERERGQVFIPEVNWALMVSCIALVLGFRRSGALASAYGIAVTGTMVITSVLFYSVAVHRWKWSRLTSASLVVAFLIVDLSFFSANIVKVNEGGWLPLVVAAGLFVVMMTWKRGTAILRKLEPHLTARFFADDLAGSSLVRVPGTAVFLTSSVGEVPHALLHHVRHNRVLHERVVLLTVRTSNVPRVPDNERAQVQDLGSGLWQVVVQYGFMEQPSVPSALQQCRSYGLHVAPETTSYYLGRGTLVRTGKAGLSKWRSWLYLFMARNAQSPAHFFDLPVNRVVELGYRVSF